MINVLALCLLAFQLIYTTPYYSCIPMQQALERAFENRSILKARDQQVDKYHSEAYAELCVYFPQVHASIIPWLSSKEKLFGKNQEIVAFSQLIFSFAGPYQRYKIAQHSVHIAELAHELECDRIRFQTEVSYIDSWKNHQQNEAIHYLDSASLLQFNKALEAHAVGLINTTTWLATIATREQAKAIVGTYENETAKSMFTLKRVIEDCISCIDESSDFIIALIDESRQQSMDYFVSKAVCLRKELAIKDEEIMQERMLEKLYNRSYLPNLSFVGVVVHNGIIPIITQNLSDTIPGFTPFKTFWFAGLNIGWEFDGLARANLGAAAHANAIAKEFERCDLEQQIILEVQTSYKDLESLHDQLAAQEAAFKQAEATFRLRSAQSEVGELSKPDFEKARYELEDELFKLKSIQASIAQQYKDVQFKSGYPDSIPINDRRCCL